MAGKMPSKIYGKDRSSRCHNLHLSVLEALALPANKQVSKLASKQTSKQKSKLASKQVSKQASKQVSKQVSK